MTHMKQFFERHIPGLIVVLAVVFLAAIAAYFSWGVGFLVDQAGRAANPQGSGAVVPGFNLTGASRLDYHGAPPAPVATSS